MKKAQITVIELSLLFLLFSSSLIYFGHRLYEENYNDFRYSVDSMADAIYYSDEFRSKILNESLTDSSLTEDWTNLTLILNEVFSNYEFTISNNTVSKKIYSCDSIYNKHFSERIIYAYNNSLSDFRKFTLGLCY